MGMDGGDRRVVQKWDNLKSSDNWHRLTAQTSHGITSKLLTQYNQHSPSTEGKPPVNG